jgi:hypothetical protein
LVNRFLQKIKKIKAHIMIKSKLTEKDFINLNFVLLYSKVYMKFLTGIFTFFIIISLVSSIFYPQIPYSQAIIFAVILLAIPLLTYFGAKRNYVNNQRVGEIIEYQFDKDNLYIKGESFNSQLTWNKVYKVMQTNNWVLIWHNRQIVNAIHKKDVLESQIKDLKIILYEQNVKNNL